MSLDEDVGHQALEPLAGHTHVVVGADHLPERVGPRLLKQSIHDHVLGLRLYLLQPEGGGKGTLSTVCRELYYCYLQKPKGGGRGLVSKLKYALLLCSSLPPTAYRARKETLVYSTEIFILFSALS